jgi:hypothetical protein
VFNFNRIEHLNRTSTYAFYRKSIQSLERRQATAREKIRRLGPNLDRQQCGAFIEAGIVAAKNSPCTQPLPPLPYPIQTVQSFLTGQGNKWREEQIDIRGSWEVMPELFTGGFFQRRIAVASIDTAQMIVRGNVWRMHA